MVATALECGSSLNAAAHHEMNSFSLFVGKAKAEEALMLLDELEIHEMFSLIPVVV
jgi:hypothetical protein